jgi:hypothetical protein
MRVLIVAALLALTLLLTGASSCSGSDTAAVNDAVGTGAPTTKASSEEDLIHLMKSVKLRMSKKEVLAVLGKPNDVQTSNSEGSKSEFWYYGEIGTWQLAFDDGFGEHKLWLTSKNHY